MTWANPPSKRSYQCNGGMLRFFRQSRGWTQEQTAHISGYSDRLIRKAESGGSLHPDTIEVLAETYSTIEQPVHPEDLINDPKAIVRTYFANLEKYNRQVVHASQSLIAEEMQAFIPGDPRIIPFAGRFNGIDAVDTLYGLFFKIFECKRPSAPTLFLSEGNDVIYQFEQDVRMQNSDWFGSMSITFHIQIERGKIILLDDHFDTQAGAKYLKANSDKLDNE